ncbi:hypothetical protein DW781_10780 [Olsenella sp. AM30-3LB]|uniref:hypothetical protein n=1 Tax=Olsenella sp. AM30-3LB TaxID=2292359 RepID=UPI000E46F6AE|nr:hypothetical protein [Olsenella sp. AM30-3LB]RHD71243.1 hypothetical protein DW781_10780 [Olsenella sp. AM30-3LB]
MPTNHDATPTHRTRAQLALERAEAAKRDADARLREARKAARAEERRRERAEAERRERREDHELCSRLRASVVDVPRSDGTATAIGAMEYVRRYIVPRMREPSVDDGGADTAPDGDARGDAS